MYRLLAEAECLFQGNYRNRNVFELIFREFSETIKKIQFPCEEHVENAKGILVNIVQYYLEIRMR